MKKPPPLIPQKPHGDLYDSVVDNPSNPAIFVVFEFDQCYPEFLISYVATKPVAAARYNTVNSLMLRGIYLAKFVTIFELKKKNTRTHNSCT